MPYPLSDHLQCSYAWPFGGKGRLSRKALHIRNQSCINKLVVAGPFARISGLLSDWVQYWKAVLSPYCGRKNKKERAVKDLPRIDSQVHLCGQHK